MRAGATALTAMRDKPAGTVRITCADHVLRTTIWPKLAPMLRHYPDINVEFDVSYGLRDIVADRFDAGVRLGEAVHKDMIAIPIGPKLRMAAVASPAYFARHPPPKTPDDLPSHRCIKQRQVGPRSTGWASPSCPKRNSPRTSKRDGSCACWRPGVRRFPAITSTTQADGTRHRRSRSF